MKPNKLTSLKAGFTVLFLSLPFTIYSQPTSSLGSESHGFAGIRLGIRDAWSAHNNPTDTHADTTLRIGCSSSRPYFSPELNVAAISVVLNVKRLALGGYAQRFGYSVSNIKRYGLSISHILSNNVTVGVGYGATSFHIAHEKTIRSQSIVIGLKQNLTRSNTMYFLIEKQTPDEIIQHNHTAFIVGYLHSVSPQIDWLNQTEIVQAKVPGFRTGIRYKVQDRFTLYTGINTAPATMSFGFNAMLSNFILSLAFSAHQELSFTPTITGQWIKD